MLILALPCKRAVTVGRLNPARLDSSRTDKRQTTRHALMRLTKSFQSSNSLIEVASLRQSDIREDFFFNRIKSVLNLLIRLLINFDVLGKLQ